MAVVNPMLSPAAIVYAAAASPAGASTAGAAGGGAGGGVGVGVKDSRWLTLDVCREWTRNKCSRSDDECRFAHPPANVEVQNGRVMCCFDSIKVGRSTPLHPSTAASAAAAAAADHRHRSVPHTHEFIQRHEYECDCNVM